MKARTQIDLELHEYLYEQTKRVNYNGAGIDAELSFMWHLVVSYKRYLEQVYAK